MAQHEHTGRKIIPQSHPSSHAILGKIGKERGTLNEEKVEIAFASKEAYPDWLKDFRKGTQEEDKKGIDFVAETDVGKLFLQIKSSVAGKNKHEEQNKKGNIAVVIIKADDNQEKVLRKSLEQLGALRNTFMKFRRAKE